MRALDRVTVPEYVHRDRGSDDRSVSVRGDDAEPERGVARTSSPMTNQDCALYAWLYHLSDGSEMRLPLPLATGTSETKRILKWVQLKANTGNWRDRRTISKTKSFP